MMLAKTHKTKNHNGKHKIFSQRDRKTDQENDEATYAITYLYKLPDGQTDRQTDRKNTQGQVHLLRGNHCYITKYHLSVHCEITIVTGASMFVDFVGNP